MSEEATGSDNEVADNAAEGGAGAQGMIETDPMPVMACPECKSEMDIEGIPAFSKIGCPSCGTQMDVPARFGHFTLLKRLGSGGMGSVFLAQDDGLGRKVAIKVMQKSMGTDPAQFTMFRNEAQSAAKLNHPHVAQIYSFGQEKGFPYLEMELVAGAKLEDMIQSGTKLDPAFVMRVGLEIAEGLKAAEDAGLFHGDVKPDNILFDENMSAKIVDFGIASMASQGQSNELWGTPYYIAPEKVQKKKNSARSDIYSLGATLYHALACVPPYDGADAVEVIKARFKGPPPALDTIRGDIDPEVVRIIGRMMYNDLFMRYPNYGSLINDIKNYLVRIPAVRKQGPLQFVNAARSTGRALASGKTGEVASSGDAPAMGKQGKKFVIQKGALAQGMATMGDTPPTLNIVANENAFDDDGNPIKPKKERQVNGLKVAIFSIGALFLLALIGGGVFTARFLMNNANVKKGIMDGVAKAAEVEAGYFKLEEELTPTLNRMKMRDEEMNDIFAQVNAIFEEATGEKLVLPDLEPPPPPPPAKEEQSGTDAAGVAESGEAKKDGAPTEEMMMAMLQNLAAAGTNENAGATMEAQMTTMMQGFADAMSTALTSAMQTAVDELPGSDVNPIVISPAAPQNPLMEKADRLVFVHARAIRAALRKCEALSVVQPVEWAPVKDTMSLEHVLYGVQLREAELKKRRATLAEMNTLIADSATRLKDMKRGVSTLRKDSAKMIADRIRLAREAQQSKAQEEAEAQKRTEAAKAKATEERDIADIQAELGKKQSFTDKFDYLRVANDMKRMEAEMRTQAGRDELNFIVQRYTRLDSLKKFIVDDLEKFNGVRNGFDSFDVIGVTKDKKAIIISSKREVPVDSLNLRQWLRLIDRLLENRDHTRPINTIERGEQLFNAAIFCYVHAGTSASALDKSRTLANQAIDMRSALRIDGPRLLPLLAEENDSDGNDTNNDPAGFSF